MKRILVLAGLVAATGCSRPPHPAVLADPAKGTFYTTEEIRGLTPSERDAYCTALDRELVSLRADVAVLMARADSVSKVTDSLKTENQNLTTTIRDLDTKVRQTRLARRAATTYLVKAGDSLQTISAQVYGDAAQWAKIYEANKDLIGDAKKPLSPGIRLTIPAK